MKRVLIWGLAAIGVATLGTYMWRDTLMMAAMRAKLAPKTEFSQALVPPAPGYSEKTSWAARPDVANPSHFVPTGLWANDAPNRVAAFFLHGTTFVSKSGWNADLDDPEASWRRDNLVLRGQASVFNLCCDVYAPKYRQATFWSFVGSSASADAAQDLAYQDVAAAFSEFRTRIGDSPFILAGHSQGSHHLLRLIKAEKTNGGMGNLVAAYLPGIGIDPMRTEAEMSGIPLCAAPDQTGCFVSWNAMSAKAVSRHTNTGDVCVNPLTWDTGASGALAAANLGALSVRNAPTFTPAFVAAECVSDRLVVGAFADEMFEGSLGSLGKGNYHLLDYALFYGNVRQNAQMRASAARYARGHVFLDKKM